jgi:hypothetical protein
MAKGAVALLGGGMAVESEHVGLSQQRNSMSMVIDNVF